MENVKPVIYRRLRLLKWLIPLALIAFVILYELGPSYWVYSRFGLNAHMTLEIVVFGTIGPVLAFLTLEMLGRWLEEKDTADLQAGLLARARRKEQEVRRVTDDTIQVLFATSLLIHHFKADRPELPSAIVSQIELTEQSLDEAIQRLRSEVLSQPAPEGRPDGIQSLMDPVS